MARPVRVLIVDDNARTREGLRALLETWPEISVVGEASDGRSAVDLTGVYRPDAVLMDLIMPVLDGMEATALIKQRWPDVLVIVLTMFAIEKSAALAAGADAFLCKGCGPDRLLAVLGVESGER